MIIGIPEGSPVGKIAAYVEMGCFFNEHYSIITKTGRKKFKDLVEGEEVLTHNMRWKKITKIHKVPLKNIPEQIKVIVQTDRGIKKIIVTPDHPFLVERAGKDVWIQAKDLLKNDVVYCVRFQHTRTEYQKTQDLIECCLGLRKASSEAREKMSKNSWTKNPRFASMKEKWKQKLSKSKIGNKICLGKRWKLGEEKKKEFTVRALINSRNMTPEQHKKQGQSLKKFYKLHPEKHPNYILSHNQKIYGGASKEQRAVFDIVKSIYKDADPEHPVVTKEGTKYIDVAVPSMKLAIEYDGVYWHKDTEREDLIRQRLIENEGWTVIRFSKVDDVRNHFGALHERA
jgi:hypothetical protein